MSEHRVPSDTMILRTLLKARVLNLDNRPEASLFRELDDNRKFRFRSLLSIIAAEDAGDNEQALVIY